VLLVTDDSSSQSIQPVASDGNAMLDLVQREETKRK